MLQDNFSAIFRFPVAGWHEYLQIPVHARIFPLIPIISFRLFKLEFCNTNISSAVAFYVFKAHEWPRNLFPFVCLFFAGLTLIRSSSEKKPQKNLIDASSADAKLGLGFGNWILTTNTALSGWILFRSLIVAFEKPVIQRDVTCCFSSFPSAALWVSQETN